MTAPEESFACAICHRVLDWATSTLHPYGHWQHAAKDQRDLAVAGDRHPPVPVPTSSIEVEARCDFCSRDVGPDEIWTLPASTFGGTLGLSVGSVGDWAACTDCAEFIQRDDWKGLVERVVKLSTGMPSAVVRQMLTAVYSDLRRHVTGPIRRGR